MRLDILLRIFSVSQFLSDTLISNPSFFERVTRPDEIHRVRSEEDIRNELRPRARSITSRDEWLKTIRIFRKREMLRIGARDLCLRKPIQEIIAELSHLACALIQMALEAVWADVQDESLVAYDSAFCILAFGKLGGGELNYSSDIDLLGLFRPPPEASEQLAGDVQTVCTQVMERLRSDLSTITEEGYVYRVDLRLRPYGRSGALVMADDALIKYYRTEAEPWELQALLKAKPVAGNRQIGWDVLQALSPLLLEKWEKTEIWSSIRNLRAKAAQKTHRSLLGSINVKDGSGGIRDIEFLVQGLQLINAHREPALLCGNTADAISLLEKFGCLDAAASRQLRDDYFFLRRVEHHLQVQADQQIHVLPSEPAELNALARRILGLDGNEKQLMRQITATMERVSTAVKKAHA